VLISELGIRLKEVERHTVFSAFGIRFWDPAVDGPVGDGLEVRAWPDSKAGRVTTAVRTSAGVYALSGLPGMGAIEHPVDDRPAPGSIKKRSFVVEVRDVLNRFVRVAFTVKLPLDYQGLYMSGVGPPENSPASLKVPPGFYLFSAPTRSPAPGLAVIRADLVERKRKCPAAYAVMEARTDDGDPWYGVADEKGRAAIFMPYPGVTPAPGPPGPGGADGSLTERTWDISIKIKYSPDSLSPLKRTKIPDLRSVFEQDYGEIWEELADPGNYEWPAQELESKLELGRELVLVTKKIPRKELWIDRKT
jgi:hypothetical protein